jgi:hypothetical protein
VLSKVVQQLGENGQLIIARRPQVAPRGQPEKVLVSFLCISYWSSCSHISLTRSTNLQHAVPVYRATLFVALVQTCVSLVIHYYCAPYTSCCTNPTLCLLLATTQTVCARTQRTAWNRTACKPPQYSQCPLQKLHPAGGSLVPAH